MNDPYVYLDDNTLKYLPIEYSVLLALLWAKLHIQLAFTNTTVLSLLTIVGSCQKRLILVHTLPPISV